MRDTSDSITPVAMPVEDFGPIAAALRSVDDFAGRLPGGDAEAHVRRSLDELRAAFTARAALEPPVDRLLRSVTMLNSAAAQGALRRFRRRSVASARLLSAIQRELLPALRRVGFEV
jgi:hypothetical protein